MEITKITNDMVKSARTINEVMPEFLKFIGDNVLVAHNADFDIGFIKYNSEELGYKFENKYIDTLSLARELFPDFKRYKLGIIAENLNIKIENAHRALDDVNTLFKVFKVIIEKVKENENKNNKNKETYKTLPVYHAIILAKNLIGLKNLYKLISFSHLNYFYKKPRILKTLYKKYSEGLIIGTACEQGELYRAIVAGKQTEEIEKIANDYDYLEIQPIANNMFMVKDGIIKNEDTLKQINKKIVDLGEKLGKLVVATCDVHFTNPEDEIYRRILMAGQGYDDADDQAPLFLRTTEEMLEEFKYLGEEKAYEVVITNTNKIANLCEKISPISSEKCPPHIEGAEKEIKKIAVRQSRRVVWEASARNSRK